MRAAVLLVLLTLSIIAKSQQVNERNTFRYDEERSLYLKDSVNHSAFKPSFSDSLNDYIALKKRSVENSKFFIRPLVDLSVTAQNQEDNVLGGFGGGLEFRFRHKKWNSGIAYLVNIQDYSVYQNNFIQRNRVIPGMSVPSTYQGSSAQSSYISAFVNFTPNKYFELEAGYGRNFIGDGYRSLLLSDAANALPYVKLQTSFWKFQYTNLFASHRNIYNVEGNENLYQQKYTASHFLDWKATKWLSVGLFETIIWGAEEGNYTRGFDLNYANPFIFYRPVEFSVGSSDNVLVGANLKFTVGKNHVFYSQLLFDEFLLGQLRADIDQFRNPNDSIQSGWWANKYGIQTGWRAFDLFSIKGLQARVEFNVIRPYTYAHSNPTQAYSNDNISLAHPLGANFYEFIARASYEVNRWNFSFNYHQNKQGRSGFGENFGENIQLSNATRVREYENELTQGTPVLVKYTEGSVSYLLSQDLGTTVSLSCINRAEYISGNKTVNQMLMLRLHSNLFNKYFDY